MNARPVVLLLALLSSGTLTSAAPPPTVFLDELTWTEARDPIHAGKSTIIVPVGGTEQNGPHLALGKHNARVKYFSGKIAAELGDALVAPVLAYVPQSRIDPPRATCVEAYYLAVERDFARALGERGFTREEIGTHAGVADTSLTLAVDPALVRADRLNASSGKADGVYGDPARSSAQIGKVGADLVIARTVEAIRKAAAPR